MPALLLVLFIGVPIAELAVLLKVGQTIGALPTILLLIFFSGAGAVLARREGLAVWRRFREAVSRGETPASEVLDGFLVLLGGALLLTPGFLTDVLGLALVVPPTRAGVKRVLKRSGKWLVLRRFPFLIPLQSSRGRQKARVVRVESGVQDGQPPAASEERGGQK